MIYFCGYPVAVTNSDAGPTYKPCGKPATIGCAFCEEHGEAYNRRPPLTEEEIVDRAAERQHDSTILLDILAICLFSAISIYKPVHTWLHAHLELLAGILLGSVLEAWMWLMFCRRPWVKR